MDEFKVFFAFVLFTCFFSCRDNDKWINPLTENEMEILYACMTKVNSNDINIYKHKLDLLSEESLPYSSSEELKKLPVYIDIYNWIEENDINFPVLFYYMIVEEKIQGEEKANTNVLLWNLADKKYPNITAKLRSVDNFNSLDLIRMLLVYYK